MKLDELQVYQLSMELGEKIWTKGSSNGRTGRINQ